MQPSRYTGFCLQLYLYDSLQSFTLKFYGVINSFEFLILSSNKIYVDRWNNSLALMFYLYLMGGIFVNVFFEGVENRSWLSGISYTQICICSRIKSFIPLCISVNLSCKGPSWPGLFADNNYEEMKLSLVTRYNVTLRII